MKKQIKRLSPHQNAKVSAILMAISSLVFLLPMLAIIYFTTPSVDQGGYPVDFPIFMFLLMPFIYLIIGYIMTAIGCVIYNFLAKHIGGFEFEEESA